MREGKRSRRVVGPRIGRVLAASLATLALAAAAASAFTGFVGITNGYFYDKSTGAPWIPHGIAYQTWNRPLGVWQTPAQIDYDLDEMVKMGANSIRVDFVWQYMEGDGDNQFRWDEYDYLVQAAEQRGIRIFALVGYQWPPDWFPDAWYTMHPPNYDSGGIWHGGRWPSDIINYEHPQARAQYAEWFQNVCGRYKDSKAIAGWIVGNEYGFLGLWSGLLDGYDPECEQAFRDYCQAKYTNIANANARWGSGFTNFNQVTFPDEYRAYGTEGAIWADAVQWRENAIGDFTAVGAKAAKTADTNHLISYSTVGMQWGEEDWRYHAEDRGKITAACLATNAPIDFFSVNNYPWSILGHESQNGHWGVSYTKKVAGVPVLYSETGFTSSETLWPGMNEARQGPLIRNSLWESLQAGAIGTHIFSWMDRPWITDREKGFGILYADRNIKPAFWVCRNTFNLMEQAKIQNLLPGSQDPRPDIAFLWTAANDSQYNRYECEMQQTAGGLERLGFDPYFMSLEDLGAGAYTNYKVVILPRNMRVDDVVPNSTNKTVLDFLRLVVIPKGIHVIAGADLPGMQDSNGRPRTNFVDEVKNLFGVDATDPGGHEGAQNTGTWVGDFFKEITVRFTTNALGAVSNFYTYSPQVWKYSDEVKVTNGGVLWAEMDSGRNRGFEDSITNLTSWNRWGTYWTNESTWGWQLDGTNMLHLWNDTGDCGIWQDFLIQPWGRYSVSTWLRSNNDDPIKGQSYASLGIEWYDKYGHYLGLTETAHLRTNTPGNSWVRHAVDAVAPSNAYTGRRLIRLSPENLLTNGSLTGAGDAPAGWSFANTSAHDPDPALYLGTTGNSWAIWWDGEIYQDVTNGFAAGENLQFGGWLRQPAGDKLRDGSKYGVILLRVFSNATQIAEITAAPPITASSTNDVWIHAETTYSLTAGATRVQVTARCNDWTSGNGKFFVDDLYLKNMSRPTGPVYVDHYTYSPAVVVKNHGAGRTALFLYSVGDMSADGNGDGDMDTLPWKWRYDVLGSIIKNYFGVQPPVYATGTNAFLCLPEYRTCTNGSILMQVKNYLYDPDAANGGTNLVFTIVSGLFSNKAIKAFDQGRILETNSAGSFTLSLPPDGQDMVLVYTPPATNVVCELIDTPAVVHPYGDKLYTVTIRYDTGGRTGLTLKVAFSGGLYSNKVYTMLATNAATGAGEQTFWMWIQDPDWTDTNYVATPDGGSYSFTAWLEDGTSNRLAASEPLASQLEWGINSAAPMPLSLSKGMTTNITLRWQDLYEPLYWQNTPWARNDAFPSRVAVYRSRKTENLYPGHFQRANEVCDWLESIGYEPANDQDVSFDNVTVLPTGATNTGDAVVLFSDTMESGTNGWTARGLWHQVSGEYFSASHAWAYNNGTNYQTGTSANTGGLVTAWIDLTNTAVVSLTFKGWYETEDTGTAWDRKLVYASLDGTNWTPVLQAAGPTGQWASYSASLTAYAGRQIKLRFLFDTVDGAYNNHHGWLIDDVVVSAFNGAVSDLFFDNLEGSTNWTASGLWRSATNRTASGTNSWVYNNGTNYATGARSSGAIVSKWISLEGAAGATLTFKSWYRTEDTGASWDRKLVYVSTNGTDWTQVLQVSGPDQQWMTPSCDLGAYAGKTIRLKFLFDTIDGLMNAYEGWYVDDVRISTVSGAGASAFSEDAEAGTNEWTAGGLWHLAADRSASPTRSWAYNNGTNYATGLRTSGSLVSRWIDLTAASCVSLTFKSWYETEDTGTSWDRKLLYATVDDTNWVQLLQVSGANLAWRTITHDLSAYAGHRIRLKFTFDSIDAVRNGYAGWYVDDIRVSLTGSRIAFLDSFDGASVSTNWVRVAGGGNWGLGGGALRAWRIGNDDNLLCAGDANWSNYTVSADLRYNAQGPYFSDAEIYARYQDRDNYVKVGIRNFYGFWRVRFVVRVRTNFASQAWLYSFSKTNPPAEGVWYNLKLQAETNTYTVYLDGENVGSFTDTNFPKGKIAVGTLATQLGIWEPTQGYFFIDDDEYGSGGASLLNLDWGYLKQFYGTLVLPSVYVMNDTEVNNLTTWITSGLYSLLAMDGGEAMKDETGAADPGRIEPLFGVAAPVSNLAAVTKAVVATNRHHVTLDYVGGDEIAASGAAAAWSQPAGAGALGTFNSAAGVPGLLAYVITNHADAPGKAFCFNFGVDTGGQLTNGFAQVARRAFDWCRSQAFRVSIELKAVVIPGNPALDVTLYATNAWILTGTGSNTVTVTLPTSGLMTGTNLYWSIYDYPWDATNGWISHSGFYSSANEGLYCTLPGLGLQVLGIAAQVYGGRDWDLWVAYDTQGTNMTAHFGVKDKGTWRDEDNFNDGNSAGWTTNANGNTNITWTVTGNALRATVGGTGGWQTVTRDGLSVTGRNITIEYDTRFSAVTTNDGDGGLLYRGWKLYVNPRTCGWADTNAAYTTNARPATGVWQHIIVNIRDGDPFWRSDLYVNNKPVYLSEPIEVTNWPSDTVGFVSPYYGGYAEVDNVHVGDEQYSFTTQAINGAVMPTNANFFAAVPDYDPAMWEYDGTAVGGQYEAYIYLRGEGQHAEKDVGIYFAPRLVVESALFPTNMNWGDSVEVPVEWEDVGTNLPMKLTVRLENPYVGIAYTTNIFDVTNASGSMNCPVTLPATIPAANDYAWVAYLWPPYATNSYFQRLGLDDTFRFDPYGMPVGPELRIVVSNITSGKYTAYSDGGLPEPGNMAYFVWGGTHDGDYTNVAGIPEGYKCWKDDVTPAVGYSGWGVFYTNGYKDLSAYNYLKFWLKTEESSVKIEVHDVVGIVTNKKSLYADQVNWDPIKAGQWQEIAIPLTNFGFGHALSNVYGTFLATMDSMPTRYATKFINANTGWMVGLPGSSHGMNVKCTTNGGLNWGGRSAGTSYVSTLMYDVDFADTSNGWVAGGYNVILGTTNAGTDWALMTNGLAAGSYWYSLDFINSKTGWACGQNAIAKTTDGGLNWSAQLTASSYVRAITFLDQNKGWACGNNLLLRTTNGGTEWVYQLVPTNLMYWRDICFFNSSTGWICGQNQLVCKTVDGGTTWTIITNMPGSYGNYLYAMAWPDTTNGWVVGGGYSTGNVFYTHNGGATWTNGTSPMSYSWLGLEFINANTGFAVGQYGYIMKTTNGTAVTPTWVDALPDARTFYVDDIRWTVAP